MKSCTDPRVIPTCVRVTGRTEVTHLWLAKDRSLRGAGSGLPECPIAGREYLEHTCWDPKDGELCLKRLKPEETLVEGRSGSDVQIDRRIWA